MKELESVAPLLEHAPKVMPYSVPPSYFLTFPDLVLAKIHSLNYNQEIPPGYFESLPGIVLDRIKNEELHQQAEITGSIINNISTFPVQSLPADYFDNFPGLLLDRIRKDELTAELEEVAPYLNKISKNPVQFVPEGYFDSLRIGKSSIGQKELAPVRSLKGGRTWLKYAVAACVAAVLCFTAYNLFDKSKPGSGPINLNQEMAKVQDSTLENYLLKEGQEPGIGADLVAFVPGHLEDVKDYLQDFSDEELQQHLKQEGDPLTFN